MLVSTSTRRMTNDLDVTGANTRRLEGNLEACGMELAPKLFFNGGRTVAKKAAKKAAPKKAAKKTAKKKGR